MRFVIHARASRLTGDAVAGLRDVLSRFPGGDSVEVVAGLTRVSLPVDVDGSSWALCEGVRAAVDPAVSCLLVDDSLGFLLR